MTTFSTLAVLACLLIGCRFTYGEGVAINATSLSPGYTSCPLSYGSNGIYQMEVPGLPPFLVFCEANIAGPGWIVIARRTNDERNFYLKWDAYKRGFGNLYADHFIGLDKVHAITRIQNHELYIRLEDFEGRIRYARYNKFYIENENVQYVLAKLQGYSGDAGDGLISLVGSRFSTFDRDHTGHCAVDSMGAWWYTGCSGSNLFGLYLGGTNGYSLQSKGMHWAYWRGVSYSYKSMVMMVRPL